MTAEVAGAVTTTGSPHAPAPMRRSMVERRIGLPPSAGAVHDTATAWCCGVAVTSPGASGAVPPTVVQPAGSSTVSM